jgi:sodium/proline symporter
MSAQLQILLSFLIFVAAFIAVGLVAAYRTQATEADYILGGRTLGPVLVGLSAGATGNSGFIMFGAVGFGYTFGLMGLLLPLGIFLGELIYWTWFPEKVNRASVKSHSATVPHLIAQALPEKDRRLVRAAVAVFVLVLIGSYASAQFIAAGRAIEQGFDISTAQGTVIGSAIILVYCTGGGFRASVWTDLIQAGVMITVTSGVLVWITLSLGGIGPVTAGLRELYAADTWQVLAGSPLSAFLFLAGFTIFGFGFSLSQPQLLVRIFAARDHIAAGRAKWTYLTFVYATFFSMVIFGAVLRIQLASIADPEQGVLEFANAHMAPWIIGIIVAGIFSAIASTADSQMLVISNTLQHDLFPGLQERLPRILKDRYLYLVTLISGVVITALALVNSATIFQIVIFSISILSSTLGPILLLLLLGRPLSRNGVLAGLAFGGIVAVSWAASGLGSVVNETAPGFVAGLAGNLLFAGRKTAPG